MSNELAKLLTFIGIIGLFSPRVAFGSLFFIVMIDFGFRT